MACRVVTNFHLIDVPVRADAEPGPSQQSEQDHQHEEKPRPILISVSLIHRIKYKSDDQYQREG